MVKLVHPQPYYLIDFNHIDQGKYSDEIYSWACNQDEYMPDGDGDIPLYGIPRLRERYDWVDKAWNMLTSFQQNEILRNEVGLKIRVYQ